jgi:hypothetical protein
LWPPSSSSTDISRLAEALDRAAALEAHDALGLGQAREFGLEADAVALVWPSRQVKLWMDMVRAYATCTNR